MRRLALLVFVFVAACSLGLAVDLKAYQERIKAYEGLEHLILDHHGYVVPELTEKDGISKHAEPADIDHEYLAFDHHGYVIPEFVELEAKITATTQSTQGPSSDGSPPSAGESASTSDEPAPSLMTPNAFPYTYPHLPGYTTHKITAPPPAEFAIPPAWHFSLYDQSGIGQGPLSWQQEAYANPARRRLPLYSTDPNSGFGEKQIPFPYYSKKRKQLTSDAAVLLQKLQISQLARTMIRNGGLPAMGLPSMMPGMTMPGIFRPMTVGAGNMPMGSLTSYSPMMMGMPGMGMGGMGMPGMGMGGMNPGMMGMMMNPAISSNPALMTAMMMNPSLMKNPSAMTMLMMNPSLASNPFMLAQLSQMGNNNNGGNTGGGGSTEGNTDSSGNSGGTSGGTSGGSGGNSMMNNLMMGMMMSSMMQPGGGMGGMGGMGMMTPPSGLGTPGAYGGTLPPMGAAAVPYSTASPYGHSLFNTPVGYHPSVAGGPQVMSESGAPRAGGTPLGTHSYSALSSMNYGPVPNGINPNFYGGTSSYVPPAYGSPYGQNFNHLQSSAYNPMNSMMSMMGPMMMAGMLAKPYGTTSGSGSSSGGGSSSSSSSSSSDTG